MIEKIEGLPIEPSPGRIVVRPDSGERKIGSLILPASNARQSHGQVVAVYRDFIDPDTEAEVSAFYRLGDWVIYGQHSGVEVTIGRQKYIVLREAELIARIVDPSTLNENLRAL